jgi:hypothetical protein
MEHGGMAPTPILGEPSSHFGHYLCDGTMVGHGGGSWKGHVWPGTIFILWALHWWGRAVHLSKKTGKGHVARSWYPGYWRCIRVLEPALKTFGPLLGLGMELRFDHTEWL